MEKLEQLLAALIRQGRTLATAESCTGGLLGKKITDISGSSAAYLGGVISYCNDVKHRLLGVSEADLNAFGAVSEPVARAMAEGVRRAVCAYYGVSVTGLAGPNGDGSGKPVGLVYIGASDGVTTLVREFRFSGDRTAVREQACEAAASLLLGLCG